MRTVFECAFDDADVAAAFVEQYQNTRFTIEEYWSLGQVASLVNDNGANAVNVTLTGGAVWNVTGTSLAESLTTAGDAPVIVPDGVTLTVNDVEYANCTLTALDLGEKSTHRWRTYAADMQNGMYLSLAAHGYSGKASSGKAAGRGNGVTAK